MSKSYKEVINKIHVDDAMKQRILQNIEQEQRSSSKDNRGEKNIFHYFQYKKLSVCAAVVVLLLCCVFYFGTSTILQPDTANQHNLAIWSKGKYSYSLYFSNGITEKEFKNHYFMKIL